MQTTPPDVVIEHELTHCPHCQTTLARQPVLQQQRRQVVDWPLQRVEYVENRIQWKACPTCQQVASSVFPKDVSAPIQFGPRLGALALYLSQQQFLPNERTCQVLPDSSRSAIATADYLARLVPSASGSAPHQTTGGTRLYGLTSS